MAMYRSKVRKLHQQREHCLPGHREQYFHHDLESFLTRASCTQLKQYIHHYEPAIQRSIKAAQQQQTCTLFTFPGFTRALQHIPARSSRVPIQPTHNPHPNLPQVAQHSNDGLSIVQRGTTINRKHTRWKQITNPLQSIRTFFSPLSE